MPAPKSWLPIDWRHPTNALLPTGHHLRPIGPHDASMAVEALRGSREHLRQTYGKVRAWPLTAMAGPQDREELRRNEDDTVTHRSFHYALFDLDETELIGCVYIDPTDEPGRTQTYRGATCPEVRGARSHVGTVVGYPERRPIGPTCHGIHAEQRRPRASYPRGAAREFGCPRSCQTRTSLSRGH